MILVAGSANLDFVVRAAQIPGPGETVLGRDFKTYPGGKGANQAVASARAGGATTHMLLALGDDDYSAPLQASLQGAGVHMHLVRVPGEATGTAFVCVSDDAENAITVAPGANNALRSEHLPPLAPYSHLLMQLETPLATVAAYAGAARAAGVQVVLNAAPAQPLDQALLSSVDLLIVNEGELAAIAGQQRSVAECLQAVAVSTIVVTLGSRGCCARHGARYLVQPAFTVTPIDTTGAGDTFCGALVAALDSGAALAEAMRLASAAGALACTVAGAQSSIPDQVQVREFLARSADPSGHDALRRYCGLPSPS